MAADDSRGNPFARVRYAEPAYARELGPIAKTIGRLVNSYGPQVLIAQPGLVAKLERELAAYAELLAPWGTRMAERMLADVSRRNANAWKAHAAKMSRALRVELELAPTGGVYQQLLAEQVKEITSLPLKAAERVQKLATEAMFNGSRANEIAKEIARSGEVSAGLARNIARTQVGTASTSLLEARALNVGSPGYFWRTAEDRQVRESHRPMDGKFVLWSAPPTLDGLTGHAGCLPNCRCHPDPVLPE